MDDKLASRGHTNTAYVTDGNHASNVPNDLPGYVDTSNQSSHEEAVGMSKECPYDGAGWLSKLTFW